MRLHEYRSKRIFAEGVDIEEVARVSPERIVRVTVDPFLGLRQYQARELAFGIGLDRTYLRDFVRIAQSLYAAFIGSDASLAEINPLVITADGELLAVDGKMLIDDNALFRHPDLAELRDLAEEDPYEQEARRFGLSYVRLDGEIGCMVNGAGLAMATMAGPSWPEPTCSQRRLWPRPRRKRWPWLRERRG